MKIAFICTGNSARSQIAEAYAKHFARAYGKKVEIYSAGAKPSGYIHPLAMKVLDEEKIDYTGQYSKSLNEIPYEKLDLVITLCGDAAGSCPFVPNVKMEYWGLSDPAKVSEEKALETFRKIRNEIKKKVEDLIKSLPSRVTSSPLPSP